MAPASSSPTAQRHVGFSRRTQAPFQLNDSSRQLHDDSAPAKKYRLMSDIMARAQYAVVERETYSDLLCEQCGSGELSEELLLCDKCDRGFHMKCVRPIVVRIPIGSWLCPKCQGGKRVRSKGFFYFSSRVSFCCVFVEPLFFFYYECRIVSACFSFLAEEDNWFLRDSEELFLCWWQEFFSG